MTHSTLFFHNAPYDFIPLTFVIMYKNVKQSCPMRAAWIYVPKANSPCTNRWQQTLCRVLSDQCVTPVSVYQHWSAIMLTWSWDVWAVIWWLSVSVGDSVQCESALTVASLVSTECHTANPCVELSNTFEPIRTYFWGSWDNLGNLSGIPWEVPC